MTFAEVYDHDYPVAMYMLFREFYGSTSSLWYYSMRYNIDIATISDFEVFPNGMMIYFRDGSSQLYERLF